MLPQALSYLNENPEYIGWSMWSVSTRRCCQNGFGAHNRTFARLDRCGELCLRAAMTSLLWEVLSPTPTLLMVALRESRRGTFSGG